METPEQRFARFMNIARSFLGNYEDPEHRRVMDAFAGTCQALLELPQEAPPKRRRPPSWRCTRPLKKCGG